jgi:hypothetical protein
MSLRFSALGCLHRLAFQRMQNAPNGKANHTEHLLERQLSLTILQNYGRSMGTSDSSRFQLSQTQLTSRLRSTREAIPTFFLSRKTSTVII